MAFAFRDLFLSGGDTGSLPTSFERISRWIATSATVPLFPVPLLVSSAAFSFGAFRKSRLAASLSFFCSMHGTFVYLPLCNKVGQGMCSQLMIILAC